QGFDRRLGRRIHLDGPDDVTNPGDRYVRGWGGRRDGWVRRAAIGAARGQPEANDERHREPVPAVFHRSPHAPSRVAITSPPARSRYHSTQDCTRTPRYGRGEPLARGQPPNARCSEESPRWPAPRTNR